MVTIGDLPFTLEDSNSKTVIWFCVKSHEGELVNFKC